MAALSAAVGSEPSLVADRKLGGVSSLRPSASESGAKMPSEAPTGVPTYEALMEAIVSVYCFRPQLR
jgi:hypothetical protein